MLCDCSSVGSSSVVLVKGKLSVQEFERCQAPGSPTMLNGSWTVDRPQEVPAHSLPVLSWFCSQAVSKPVWHIPLLCVQWKTPYDGQRDCLKHAEFYSKNKFEKLVHLVGFIIRIYHDARSPERQTVIDMFICQLNHDIVGPWISSWRVL